MSEKIIDGGEDKIGLIYLILCPYWSVLKMGFTSMTDKDTRSRYSTCTGSRLNLFLFKNPKIEINIQIEKELGRELKKYNASGELYKLKYIDEILDILCSSNIGTLTEYDMKMYDENSLYNLAIKRVRERCSIKSETIIKKSSNNEIMKIPKIRNNNVFFAQSKKTLDHLFEWHRKIVNKDNLNLFRKDLIRCLGFIPNKGKYFYLEYESFEKIDWIVISEAKSSFLEPLLKKFYVFYGDNKKKISLYYIMNEFIKDILYAKSIFYPGIKNNENTLNIYPGFHAEKIEKVNLDMLNPFFTFLKDLFIECEDKDYKEMKEYDWFLYWLAFRIQILIKILVLL